MCRIIYLKYTKAEQLSNFKLNSIKASKVWWWQRVFISMATGFEALWLAVDVYAPHVSCIYLWFYLCLGWTYLVSRSELQQRSSLGRYCFKRRPFGITSAPEIFPRKMSEKRAWRSICVYRTTRPATHQSFREEGVMWLKAEPMRKEQRHFLGRLIDRSGVRPDPEKVEGKRRWHQVRHITLST